MVVSLGAQELDKEFLDKNGLKNEEDLKNNLEKIMQLLMMVEIIQSVL